jgi:hypothetical protein
MQLCRDAASIVLDYLRLRIIVMERFVTPPDGC